MPSAAHSKSTLHTFWHQAGRTGAAYLAAEALAKGGIYVLFVWLATLLTVDDFGLLNVYVSLLTILAAGVGLGISEGLVRFHFSDLDFRAVLTIALVLPPVVALILLLVVVPVRSQVATSLNVPSALIVLAIAGAPLVALRQSWLGVLRARREAPRYFIIRIIEPAVLVAALIALVWTDRILSYSWTAFAYTLAIGAAAAAGLFSVGLQNGLRWSAEPLRPLLSFSLPLVAHGLAMAGLTAFDQLVLQQILGAGATGTYAYAYRFAMAMALLVFALGAAWGPFVLLRLQQDQSESLTPLARTAFRLLIGACIALAWVTPVVAGWVGGDSYARALAIIPLVVYAYLWMGIYSLAAVYLYFRNRSAVLAAASGTAFFVNAALNYLTVPLWGPVAAAVTTIASYMLLSLLVWCRLGEDRHSVPMPTFAFQAALVAPVILAASLFFS